jgi:hypothetical protein
MFNPRSNACVRADCQLRAKGLDRNSDRRGDISLRRQSLCAISAGVCSFSIERGDNQHHGDGKRYQHDLDSAD